MPSVCRAVILLLIGLPLQAYSVLTHMALIDASWDNSIRPLLLDRFPNASRADLKDARAHAYAGCIIQDMGYYPFGSKFYTDLVHYVRSGDFILNLLRESQSLDEFAFSLGALEHYAADRDGHAFGVNPSVALEYPKLRRKYGDVVTYEDNPAAHMKVEFGFDVLQVARGAYASEAYHDFIGFVVARPVLERAFRDTYGLEFASLFTDLDVALGTYRRSVSTIIPEMTTVAWSLKKDELPKAHPGITRGKFVYRLSGRQYGRDWKERYQRPGIGAKILALFIRIVPKVGIFRVFSFKAPTKQTERLFQQSFDRALELYRSLVAMERSRQLQLADLDFDTGQPTRLGEYRMADDAYAKLAIKLADKDPAAVDPALRRNILGFFNDLNQPHAAKRDAKQWQQTIAAVEKLRSAASRESQPLAPGSTMSKY